MRRPLRRWWSVQACRRPTTNSEARSEHQGCESGADELAVGGQDVGDAAFPHDVNRDAVLEAEAAVSKLAVVEGESGFDYLRSVGDHFDTPRCAQFARGLSGPRTRSCTVACDVGEQLLNDSVGSDQGPQTDGRIKR